MAAAMVGHGAGEDREGQGNLFTSSTTELMCKFFKHARNMHEIDRIYSTLIKGIHAHQRSAGAAGQRSSKNHVT